MLAEIRNQDLLFVEHVPGLGDTLLALGARVDVETSSEDHESHVLYEQT